MTQIQDKKLIRKEILFLIIPMIIESILQVSAGLISTAMIGRLLASDVSAQGVCIRITDTLWCFYKGVSIASTILIARAYGAGNLSRCRRVTEQTFLTEIPISLVFSAFLMFFSVPIFSFFTHDPELLIKAQEYMQIIIFGFPFVVIMSVVTATFQGFGDTKTPMIIALILNIVNIICGYAFIFGFGIIPAMGIKGAALSLVVSQGSAAVLGLFLLYRKKGLFSKAKQEFGFFTFDIDCIKEIYTTGIPAALESMFWQLSAIFLSKMILMYGQTSFAAYQIGIQAETITEMPAIGFGTAATTLIARAIGKNDSQLKDVYFKELLSISTKISIATSLMLILLPNVFMNIMTNNAELQKIGVVYVFIMGFIQIPQNLSRIYNGALRASGYKKVPMLVAGFGIWIVRIPLCFLVSTILKWDITFIWLIIAFDQISRFILSAIIYKRAGNKSAY